MRSMLRHITASCLLLASALSTASAQEIKLESEIDKVSYLIGRNIGGSMRNDGLELNLAALVAGLTEGMDDKESRISDADAATIMASFQQKMQAEQAAKAAKAGGANAEAGAKFLAENKQRGGVKVTASGLQYEILKAGEGPKPGASDTVSVHYHGTLIDGTVFDSSVDRGQPATFPVGGVIPGWVEALQLMPSGSKWKLVIPANLAYGPQGAGGAIGPNSTLVFEVELLSIQAKDAAPTAQ